jgi:hypothetical protein
MNSPPSPAGCFARPVTLALPHRCRRLNKVNATYYTAPTEPRAFAVVIEPGRHVLRHIGMRRIHLRIREVVAAGGWRVGRYLLWIVIVNGLLFLLLAIWLGCGTWSLIR